LDLGSKGQQRCSFSHLLICLFLFLYGSSFWIAQLTLTKYHEPALLLSHFSALLLGLQVSRAGCEISSSRRNRSRLTRTGCYCNDASACGSATKGRSEQRFLAVAEGCRARQNFAAFDRLLSLRSPLPWLRSPSDTSPSTILDNLEQARVHRNCSQAFRERRNREKVAKK